MLTHAVPFTNAGHSAPRHQLRFASAAPQNQANSIAEKSCVVGCDVARGVCTGSTILATPPNKEVDSSFKISTKRSLNSALYQKISSPFRKISDYGTSSKIRGIRGAVRALSFYTSPLLLFKSHFNSPTTVPYSAPLSSSLLLYLLSFSIILFPHPFALFAYPFELFPALLVLSPYLFGKA